MKNRLILLNRYLGRIRPLLVKKGKKGIPPSGREGEFCEFLLKPSKVQKNDIQKIKEFILLFPFTVSTRPVVVRLTGDENSSPELKVSFTLINRNHCKQLEEFIRLMVVEGP